jgi:hypothetical protein
MPSAGFAGDRFIIPQGLAHALVCWCRLRVFFLSVQEELPKFSVGTKQEKK